MEWKGKETPITKDGGDKAGTGAPRTRGQAHKARRGMAIINCMAQDRPDLFMMARVLSQHITTPTEGTYVCEESPPVPLDTAKRDVVSQG